jgi:hexosaminidase
VLFTIAQLCRQSLNMLLDLKRINEFLILASNIAPVNPLVAISLVDQALDQVTKIRNDRNLVLDAVTTVWYHDWYPRVAEANGRKYLDQVDDVKDHPPARTVDMSYLIYRELKYPLGQWAEEVRKLRNQFARDNNLNIRGELINWLKY